MSNGLISKFKNWMTEEDEYYDDEEIYEKYDKWIEDFCSQIPEDRQEYYRTLIKENKQEY